MWPYFSLSGRPREQAGSCHFLRLRLHGCPHRSPKVFMTLSTHEPRSFTTSSDGLREDFHGCFLDSWKLGLCTNRYRHAPSPGSLEDVRGPKILTRNYGFTRSDLLLTSGDWSTLIMGIISRDLNLESSEASVRKAAEARLQVPPSLALKLNFFSWRTTLWTAD